ncbi:ABC transporter ATP-binding protein [Dactylosporangium sp. NPDC051485]|uniref:ABC transporter ATP-binding protein n=1 Tax=Dactylosporangium sp. NPDC051485 TaxID=3154846 RepID=UPI003440920D
MSAGLLVEALSAAYGPATVLREVSFAVAPGETFGLVGESGCGKTTLGYLLGGHLRPGGRHAGGRVTVDGVDVLALDAAALRRWRRGGIAFVHQDGAGALDPTMRIGAQVAEVLRLRGLGRRAAAAEAVGLLDRVGLPGGAARRYPHQLSGGQRQRVMIAAVLAARPRLLVLDEPTTGLDAATQAEVLDLLARLRAELSAAVVLISHDLELVGRHCDRVGVLYAGRLVESGPAAEVLADPAHPYTAGLLDSAPRRGVPRTVRRLAAIPGRPPLPGDPVAGCVFAARCPVADSACAPAEPAPADLPGGRAVACVHPRTAPRRRAETAVAVPAAVPVAEPLLEVHDLTRAYAGTAVLERVDLTIGRGEVVGLVGESGSGKTTLARAIAGLHPDGTGRLRFAGADLPARLARRDPDVRRRIQMVFQDPDTTLNPAQTVRRILERARRTLGGEPDVDTLAARTRLDGELLDRRPDRLSGGQRQRVAIARSFAGRPALVICDEPVSALDVSVQAAVLEVLAEQRERTGTSYLFISHDLAVVGYLADRIAVLYRGVLVEQGPAHAVLAGPHHPYTAALVGAGRPAPPALAPAAGCRFFAACFRRIEGLCDTTAPPDTQLGPRHTVRCHLDPAALPRTDSITSISITSTSNTSISSTSIGGVPA